MMTHATGNEVNRTRWRRLWGTPWALALLLGGLWYAGPLRGQDGDLQGKVDAPRTVAEASAFARTSTSTEARAFLDALASQPHAARLRRSVIGATMEGKPIELVTVAEPMPADEAALLASPRLRIFVNANIHAGEVEGKEAVLQLLREFAQGEHAALLEHAVLFFVPVYNGDGNDRIRRSNRTSQNGPDEGVGERENAAGLDLNRDFMKLESPEARALVPLLARLDPHLFLDLHTTNGTDHGYALTYATSLVPSLDPELERYAHGTFLPDVSRRVLERHGVHTFDYGNLGRARADEAPRWQTYDHRPRFGTNMLGLRNRLTLLSEAFSYLDFEARIAATRAFVLEAIEVAVRDRERLRRITSEADQRVLTEAALPVAIDADLEPGTPFSLRLQRVREVEVPLEDGAKGTRRVATGEVRTVDALAQVRFVATRDAGLDLALDGAWVIPAPSDAVLRTLALHGIETRRLERALHVEDARVFVLRAAPKARRPFQGHLERTFEGEWRARGADLPVGACIVPRRQRLARLAAWLLEPESDDSLGTWNFFYAEVDAALPRGDDAVFPVWRVTRGL
ncbi:MAG: M14 family metallopeptidase [Planctomycetota bacterium]